MCEGVCTHAAHVCVRGVGVRGVWCVGVRGMCVRGACICVCAHACVCAYVLFKFPLGYF